MPIVVRWRSPPSLGCLRFAKTRLSSSRRALVSQEDHSKIGLSFCCEVVPEVIETLGATKESGEDCQVCKQDVASARPCRRHPEERIKFSVTGLDERMRSGQIDRLSSKHTNCACIFRRQRIVRQVLVKIEGWNVREPTMPVEITHGRQRREVVGVLDDCWTKAEAIFHRYPEAFHERSGV